MRHRLTPLRLRQLLAALFLALALPTAVLVWETQRQLKWEAFHYYRSQAEELAARIDAELRQVVAAEEARSYGEYAFLVVAGEPAARGYLQRSTLSQLTAGGAIPGLVGYFQIDADGVFSTPLLPASFDGAELPGISEAELAERRRRRDLLLDVLSRNRLVEHRRGTDNNALARPLPPPPAIAAEPEPYSSDSSLSPQAMFDRLQKTESQRKSSLGRVEDLQLDERLEVEQRRAAPTASAAEPLAKQSMSPRAARKEQSAVLEAAPSPVMPGIVKIFESEIDPFEFGLLDSGHLVLFRKVWRDGRRTVQGAIIEQQPFLRGLMQEPFRDTALARMSNLVVAYQGEVLAIADGDGRDGNRADELRGTLLYQTRLSAPLGGMQLLWTINRLPAGPGATVVLWASIVLMLVLTLGFFALYRLGLRQITLVRQQQDFVSAISHELKTPLTSIRMYGELLREGWASEEKKREYYRYIHDESERLSRLIANVLQLARMERNDLRLELKPVAADTLMDLLRSKVASQLERAEFEVSFELDPACRDIMLKVDSDAFTQIVINLVDNAIKFSARAPDKRIVIAAQPAGRSFVAWSVRDHGPGVPKSEMKKIFRLFYRPGSELTRETVGTGIGLALVQQLVRAMAGTVDVVNREPGAEFVVTLPTF